MGHTDRRPLRAVSHLALGFCVAGSACAAPSDGSTAEDDPPSTGSTASDANRPTAPPQTSPGASAGSSGGASDTIGDGAPGEGSDDEGPPGDCTVEAWFSEQDWDSMFLHKDDPACPGSGTYTYDGFLAATTNYPDFGCEGDEDARRREVAAFLAQVSHETTGGWATAPDGPYSWGLCFNEEVGCESGGCTQYCDAGNTEFPCVPGQTYHGRGAMQLSWNYNYGLAGSDLGVDLLASPGLVVTEPDLAIGTALWFWMTPQPPKPSAHDVMAGNWTPSEADVGLGRLPGFGMTTNIINGGLECGQPTTPAVEDRVGFFERYASIVGSSVGDNLLCDEMAPY